MRNERGWAAGVALLGLAVGVLCLVLAVNGAPGAGVVPEEVGGRVLEVVPGSPAWQAGIRVGQTVLVLQPGARAEDWMLTTTDGVTTFRIAMNATIAELRSAAPIAGLAVVLGLLGVLLVWTRPDLAAALGTSALVLAAVPVAIAGDAVLWSVAALLVALAMAAWLVGRGRLGRLRMSAGAAIVVVTGGWLVARLAVPSAFAPFDAVRGGVTAAGLALGWVWTIDRTGAVQRARQAGVPNRLDLAILAVVLGVMLAARIVLGADPWLLVVITTAVALLYSRFRRGLNRAIDRVFMAETRERAAIGAIEAERARVARDLHDEPLQELSGVIKNLELMPEAAREAAALRGVAQHLRDVATELYPPHLRDLGLGPALEHLVHQANISASVPVELELSDAPGIRAEDRLPGDIEVALYRITQEAIANAQRHSGGSLIQVTASLSGGRATLVVHDDGIGIKPSAIEAAQRDGRFGMASMRQRAAGIGASIRTETGDTGTSVLVEWEPDS